MTPVAEMTRHEMIAEIKLQPFYEFTDLETHSRDELITIVERIRGQYLEGGVS